jgi:hypothetical protein
MYDANTSSDANCDTVNNEKIIDGEKNNNTPPLKRGRSDAGTRWFNANSSLTSDNETRKHLLANEEQSPLKQAPNKYKTNMKRVGLISQFTSILLDEVRGNAQTDKSESSVGINKMDENDNTRKKSLKIKSPTIPQQRHDEHSDVCKLEDSPYYIFRVRHNAPHQILSNIFFVKFPVQHVCLQAAGQGLADVVGNLLNADPSRVNAVDLKQWTCLHHAANRNRVTIIDLLVDRGAGK